MSRGNVVVLLSLAVFLIAVITWAATGYWVLGLAGLAVLVFGIILASMVIEVDRRGPS